MPRTPYEIRFDLLNYAMGHLTGQYYSDLERIRESSQENSPERITKIAQLKYPTKSEIINLANEYKEFIDNK